MDNERTGWAHQKYDPTPDNPCKIETIELVDVDEIFPKDKMLIFFPNEGNYVEILGHRIDFDGNGYEEFVEYIHKLATYEKSENNWNELKKWVEENMKSHVEDSYAHIAYAAVLNKIRRLENVSNDINND